MVKAASLNYGSYEAYPHSPRYFGGANPAHQCAWLVGVKVQVLIVRKESVSE